MVVHALFEKDLGGLEEHQRAERLDDRAREVRARRVQEAVVDVAKKPGGLAHARIRTLNAVAVGHGARLRRRDARHARGRRENHTRLFVRERLLRHLGARERIAPSERHPQLRKAQLEHLEHMEPAKQQVPRGRVARRLPHRVVPRLLNLPQIRRVCVCTLLIRRLNQLRNRLGQLGIVRLLER